MITLSILLGTTALHHAAMLGSADATKILLLNGAWPTYKCKSSGSTPLHIVASTGSIETLMVLLEAMQCHNIDIDTRDQVNYVRHCSSRITNAR